MRIAWILALAVLAGAPARAAPRVLSLDQCADQFVLALSPREAIVGLSFRADDADSYLRSLAAGLPQRRASTEAVLAARPQVVVRYWGGDERLAASLARRGVEVVKVDDATDFEGVEANVRKVAAALGVGARGEAIIARMHASLAAAASRPPRGAGLYLTPGGFTAGPGTLIDAMMRAGGLADLAAPGFAPVSLERLALRPAAGLVLGFFDGLASGHDHWGGGRHAVATVARRTPVVASLPGSILGCPAWFAADGAGMIASGRP